MPSWFAYCAGEKGQCNFKGQAQVIFGTSWGSSPALAGYGGFYSQTISGGVACNNDSFGDPDGGHTKACWFGPVAGLPAGKILETGGSVYPFYVQNYQSWDDNQRAVLGLYNLDPTIVEAQLTQMYKSGQRKVALMLWYMPFDNPDSPLNAIPAQWPDVWGAYVNSAGGQLSPQLKQNLQNVLALVQSIGFTQVTLRFAPIGTRADPVLWGNNWNEYEFQRDETFIFNTRQYMESLLAGSSIPHSYDLGVEKIGIPHNANGDGTYTDGQTPQWSQRLWADYVARFGKANTYGFSIAYSYGALAAAIAAYDYSGVRPDSYAIDSGSPSDMWYVYEELVGAGEPWKPIVVQEVSYNDADQMQGMQTVLQHTPLTVAYIDQWPLNLNTPGADGVSPPTNYGAYGGSSGASGTIVAYPCTLAPGQSTCNTTVSWATSNASNVALYVNGSPAANLPNITTTLTGSSTITLGDSPTTLVLQSDQGGLSLTSEIRVAAATQSVLDQKTLFAINPNTPVLTTAGVGGSAHQAIWALGSNISSNCQVSLFDPSGTGWNYIATLTNVSCQTNSLSFELPSWVLSNFTAVNFVVTNATGQSSGRLYAQFQSGPQLSIAGLGGSANQMIWALGNNFRAGCAVNLYDANNPGGDPLQTVTDVACGGNNLSFTIPNQILWNYAALNFTVTNTDGQASTGLRVNLH